MGFMELGNQLLAVWTSVQQGYVLFTPPSGCQ